MELVDIVNQDNQVIGQTTKQEAHIKGLLHRTIISELITSKGEWVLVKQAGDRQDPGQYVSPIGGHIRAGESNLDALERETQEEVGLFGNYIKLPLLDKENLPTELVGKGVGLSIPPNTVYYQYIGQAIYDRKVLNRHENHYFVLYHIYSNQEPILNHESVSFKRFTQNDLKQQLHQTPEFFGAAFHFVIENFYPQLHS